MTVDLKQIEEWDRKYCLRTKYTQEEYHHHLAIKTEGSYIHLADGRKLLDFMSGLLSVNIGYCHPKVQAAIKEAADRFSFIGDIAFCTEYKARLAKLIVEDIVGPDDWAGGIRFCVTGSEANEAAFIIAKLFTNRPTIVTREWSYHGFSMGAAGATTLRGYRSTMTSPSDPSWVRDVPGHPSGGFLIVPGNYCYRCSLGHTYPSCKEQNNSHLPCVSIIRSMIEARGAETVAAIITEVAQGVGNFHPAPEYIPQLRKLTKDLGILWIDDEVICGFGRLGRWFAYQKYGVTPDIMTMAKGITSSAFPVAAVVVSREIAEFLNKHRFFGVGTFAHHPIGMAAALANIEAMIEERVIERAAEMGEYIKKQLRKLETEHKCVGQIEGEGVFWSVELVKNRKTREPFTKIDRNFSYGGNLSTLVGDIVSHKAIHKGVLIGGFVPNSLRLGPPCTVSREEVDKAMEALDYAFSHVNELCD